MKVFAPSKLSSSRPLPTRSLRYRLTVKSFSGAGSARSVNAAPSPSFTVEALAPMVISGVSANVALDGKPALM